METFGGNDRSVDWQNNKKKIMQSQILRQPFQNTKYVRLKDE